MKNKCEICKCLNLIAEGKKHPSQTIWNSLTLKCNKIKNRDPKSITTFCEKHRTPLYLVADLQSIDAFVEEVFTTIEKYLLSV